MRYLTIGSKEQLFKKYENDIYRLRHKVFKEKLNWKVNSTQDNKEIDYFDNLPEVYFVLAIEDNEKLVGCMRLLPTTSNYMLEDIFPELLPNCPKDEDIWEISRFTIDPNYQKETTMLCLNKPTLYILKGMCEFAKEKHISSYIAATTSTLNRLVRTVHMDTEVIGVPTKIDNTKVIALQIFMNEQTFTGLDERLVEEDLLV